MNFYEKRKGPPVVPILPMIDILAILLVFFILTTEEKTERHQLEIRLASVSNMDTAVTSSPASLLSVDAEGRSALDGMEIAEISMIGQYLTEFAKQNPGRKLELEVDRGLDMGLVISVWDELTKAGYTAKEVPLRVLSAREDAAQP